MPSVRIYHKKQIRLDRLNVRQTQMFKLANVGVATVKNRVAAAQGPEDNAAKPLTKRYAIWKTKLGRGNRRNLMLTGDMLRNFQVRTVSENKGRAGNSTRKDRIKAWITNKIEPWVVFSPRNRATVHQAAQRILAEIATRLAVERRLGGKQQ
jgi:hypothetical protein